MLAGFLPQKMVHLTTITNALILIRLNKRQDLWHSCWGVLILVSNFVGKLVQYYVVITYAHHASHELLCELWSMVKVVKEMLTPEGNTEMYVYFSTLFSSKMDDEIQPSSCFFIAMLL